MTEPALIECPACGGRGCEFCADPANLRIEECPMHYVDAGTPMLVRLAELLDHGLPPEPGGALDQTWSFLEAAAFVRSERSRNEAELKARPNG